MATEVRPIFARLGITVSYPMQVVVTEQKHGLGQESPVLAEAVVTTIPRTSSLPYSCKGGLTCILKSQVVCSARWSMLCSTSTWRFSLQLLTPFQPHLQGKRGALAVRCSGTGTLQSVRMIGLSLDALFWFHVDSSVPGAGLCHVSSSQVSGLGRKLAEAAAPASWGGARPFKPLGPRPGRTPPATGAAAATAAASGAAAGPTAGGAGSGNVYRWGQGGSSGGSSGGFLAVQGCSLEERSKAWSAAHGAGRGSGGRGSGVCRVGVRSDSPPGGEEEGVGLGRGKRKR